MTITETEAKWHVDAGTRVASKAWRAVSLAAGEDDRPSLDRTMLVEIYPGGIRLVATDTYILSAGAVIRTLHANLVAARAALANVEPAEPSTTTVVTP